jgi:hypothetical protein
MIVSSLFVSLNQNGAKSVVIDAIPIFVDGSATWTDPISVFIAAVFPWLGITAVVKGRAAVITAVLQI